MKEEEVTILVHGTFANPEYGASTNKRWWRLGKGGYPGNMAEKLQEARVNVWEPGRDDRDGDLTYRDLGEWSGANTHKARIEAAKNLARALKELAKRRKCGPEAPLLVNFVAHSHGGNVVLECLKYLPADVKPRQLCLLGAPLTWRFVDLRIVYLPLLLWFLWLVVGLFSGGEIPGLGTIPVWTAWGPGVEMASRVLLGLALLPLPLWFAAAGIKLARQASMSFLGIHLGRPAYGPLPKVLQGKVRGRPVALYISEEDEADLMLQVGAAPLDTYRAMVEGRPSLKNVESIPVALGLSLLKYVEFAYVRPLAHILVVPFIEFLLEWKVLGYPFLRLSFTNLEMVSWMWDTETYDKKTQVVPWPVSAHSLRRLGVTLAKDRIGVAEERRRAPDRRRARVHALRQTLLQTAKGLMDQVHLRHSGYYESPQVIDDVAKTIAAGRAAGRASAFEEARVG